MSAPRQTAGYDHGDNSAGTAADALYNRGGLRIQKPLVAVIFGGMISSLVLELIVLPVLYVLVNDKAAATKPEIARA